MKNLGKRMKVLENTNEILWKENIPVIIKLENKGINNFMKKNISILEDHLYFLAMRSTMEYMCKNIPNCKFAYTQTNIYYLLILLGLIEIFKILFQELLQWQLCILIEN